jgi:hypothetical protein
VLVQQIRGIILSSASLSALGAEGSQTMTIPKAFISYSHDSLEHKTWVLRFATRLRSMGVDAILDQWELKPGDDVPHFMEQHLAAADRVLMICTERYVEKANSGSGGVGYEKMIVTAELMKNITSSKVIPVIRQNGTRKVPTFLQSKLFIDFSNADQFEFSIDELARAIHAAPLYEKPPISNSPFSPQSSTPTAVADPLRELMRILATDFERHTRLYSFYKEVLKASGMSRIMFDVQVAHAREAGYVTVGSGYIQLTDKGKSYIIENKLSPA